MSPRVLVAGIGNIFLGDDGFGVALAQRLAAEPAPAGVRVAEFGIRGVHLAYELLDGYDVLVLLDALPMGEPPGTVAVIEPEHVATGDGVATVVDAHDMNPGAVLATLGRLGGEVGRVLVLGCQPADVTEGIGLSAPVEAALDRAVEVCHELLDDILQPAGRETHA